MCKEVLRCAMERHRWELMMRLTNSLDSAVEPASCEAVITRCLVLAYAGLFFVASVGCFEDVIRVRDGMLKGSEGTSRAWADQHFSANPPLPCFSFPLLVRLSTSPRAHVTLQPTTAKGNSRFSTIHRMHRSCTHTTHGYPMHRRTSALDPTCAYRIPLEMQRRQKRQPPKT